MYSVYRHTCPNGKIYIGITSKNPEIRWRGRYRNNKHFSSAIKKYGWENIKHEILFENLTQEEAEQKEIELIQKYDSTNQEKGYNIAKGGKTNSGFKHSDETKEKIKTTLSGHKHNKKTIQKMRKSARDNWKNQEHKEKMSKAHIGKQAGKNNPLSRVVFQYSLEKTFIKQYESVGRAENETGINHRQISDCCNHKQRTCHGYIWSYEKL